MDTVEAMTLLLFRIVRGEGLVGAERLAGAVDIGRVNAVDAEIVRGMEARPGDLVDFAPGCRFIDGGVAGGDPAENAVAGGGTVTVGGLADVAVAESAGQRDVGVEGADGE